MTRLRIREEAKIAACLLGGLLGVVLVQMAYGAWGYTPPGLLSLLDRKSVV